jgi:DNA-binding NarL/FixJ family response regulator
VSANAIVKEAMTAPIVATAEYGWTGVFPAGDTHPMALSGISAADPLTRREREVADRMGRGLSNREIARELHLAPDTVKAHVARVLRKLGASNRAEAVAVYLTLTRPAAN